MSRDVVIRKVGAQMYESSMLFEYPAGPGPGLGWSRSSVDAAAPQSHLVEGGLDIKH